MTTILALFISISTILTAGFGIAMLLSDQRVRTCELFALAWLLGTTVVSLSLWIGGLVLRGIFLQLTITVICVLLGTIGLKRWRSLPSLSPSDSPRSDMMFGSLFVIELGLLCWISFQHSLGWDGITVWELKARYAFLNGGTLPVNYFSDVSRWFSHPEYPLLLPLTETWLYLWMGEANQFFVKFLFPLWYFAAMSMLLVSATLLSGRRWLGWICVILFPLVPAIYSVPGGVQVGYADLPLAAVYIGAVTYLLQFVRSGTPASRSLFVALSATLPWMKREGAILFVVVSTVGVVEIFKRCGARRAILSLVPGVTVILAWKLFLMSTHSLASRDFVPVSVEALRANLNRTSAIAHELYVAVSDLSQWDVFWIVTLIALICVVFRQRSRQVAIVVWLLAVPLFGYCASYVLSAWPNLIAHIDTSLPRLLIQLTPISWLLVALALKSTPTSPAPPGRQPNEQSVPETGCS